MHNEQLWLHIITEAAYFAIAFQFFFGFFYSEKKEARFSLILLALIFVLCGLTRIMMFLDVNNYLHDFIVLILPIVAWAFVFANKPQTIINALKNERIIIKHVGIDLNEKIKGIHKNVGKD